MQKIKVGDNVIVLTGKDKKKTGQVKFINRKKGVALVEGINLVTKTVKQSEQNPNASFDKREAPLDVSNIAVVSPKTKKPTRVRIEKKDNKNIRVAVACATQLRKGGRWPD